jgi:hypothetical protein
MNEQRVQAAPTWFGDYLRSRTDDQLFRMLYERMRGADFRQLLSEARRWSRTRAEGRTT